MNSQDARLWNLVPIHDKPNKSIERNPSKTWSFLKTIFDDFYLIFDLQKWTQNIGFFGLLINLASKAFQDSPRPLQEPPRTLQGHQKAPQDPPRRSPKHPKDAKWPSFSYILEPKMKHFHCKTPHSHWLAPQAPQAFMFIYFGTTNETLSLKDTPWPLVGSGAH